MLRFGVVPIVVLEGVTPDAKQALLDARHMATHGRARASRVGASNAQNTNLQRKARQLLEALVCWLLVRCGWCACVYMVHHFTHTHTHGVAIHHVPLLTQHTLHSP